MINPNTRLGKVMVVFFWGGLAASIVNMAYSFHRFDPFMIAWLVVLVNIVAVTIKNWLFPPEGKK